MIKLKKIYWRIFIAILSLKWIPSFNLGDIVIFQGKEWVLLQGVNKPYWSLSCKNDYVTGIHEDYFYKKKSIKNYIQSFRSGYRFYMTSWFDIWVSKGIEPWMRNCDIWK